jgi:thiamine biosynthesis lipoprotein
MGTSYSITLVDRLRSAELREIKAAVEKRLAAVNDNMSTWQPDSEISQFNHFKSLEKFPVSQEFVRVVERALQTAKMTDGAFDPTVKPLVDHWGFGPETDSKPLAKIMQSVGWRKVVLDENSLSKKEENVQLDLSAIAKGYGVDAVAKVIRSFGVKNFLVEIGGEIAVSGLNPKGKPWRVGIELPNPTSGREIFQTVELSGGAMATSGDYRNFRTREDGSRYSHIIDPHTGRPAETDIASVSVLANSCMDADAVATALFVMDSGKSFQWLESHSEFQAFFILHSTNQTFATLSTPGFPNE